jgi:hypothetical protein
MYIGADFLIDRDSRLYLSEVNTGIPAGAQEYDFVYRLKFGTPSGVFQRIESLAQRYFEKTFREYMQSLSFMDDLRALKIWMDGKGPFPEEPNTALRLEDKWVQYLILSKRYPVIPTEIFLLEKEKKIVRLLSRGIPVVFKKRYGRGGKGFVLIKEPEEFRRANLAEKGYIMQPYVESGIDSYRFSIRAASFMGHFICMFASLSQKSTSNHGIRFFILPGEGLEITKKDFKIRKIVQKSWEADIFYKGDIPDYLYHDVYEERIAEAELIIPEHLYGDIQRISASVSELYRDMDFESLPESYLI